MDTRPPEHSWFGPDVLAAMPETFEESSEFVRLWQGFMTARLTVGLAIATLQITLLVLGAPTNRWLIAISLVYFFSTLAARFLASPQPLGKTFNRVWMRIVGLDLAFFMTLQALQGGGINYTPLCALPVLVTAVLGSLRLSLGTAATITMLLLAGSWWEHASRPAEATPYLVQSALSGVGYFAIALLANQLATRLAREGERARTSLIAARIQQEVNELVIESLPDGVLIVDSRGLVRAANPAGRRLLGPQRAIASTTFSLTQEVAWHPLLKLCRLCIGTKQMQTQDITITHEGQGPRRVRARTRLASPQGTGADALCVLFLQDQRELEARLRTEKLASMGRLSTAVAHEIRNPLAAIAQANALLDEELTDPSQKRLTHMVGQNTQRLEKIVDDILKVARVHPGEEGRLLTALNLPAAASQICADWAQQNQAQSQLGVSLMETPMEDKGFSVRFDLDHLQRVLINLLDNAQRYASARDQSIQVSTNTVNERRLGLSVWSDGAPMEQSVERHLFEPFFSSESRSSGLGLYICRELCERHGASIVYQRSSRKMGEHTEQGNEFAITFLRADAREDDASSEFSALT